jgi:hypothetical protein
LSECELWWNAPEALRAAPISRAARDLLARLQHLAGRADLTAVTFVCCPRYALEDDRGRFTLDVAVRTDEGKGKR